MKIEITGSPKEIAALVLAVQERQKVECLTIGGVSTKAHSDDRRTRSEWGSSQRGLWLQSEHPLTE